MLFRFLPSNQTIVTEFTASGSSELPAFESSVEGAVRVILANGRFRSRIFRPQSVTGTGRSRLPAFASSGVGQVISPAYDEELVLLALAEW